VQDADEGDTATSVETLIDAAEQVETVVPDGEIIDVVADRGYHSNQVMVDLEAVGVRRYISEPDRGRRNWKKHPEARDAVYRNRRRICVPRGQRLLRVRGER
jgi:transposase